MIETKLFRDGDQFVCHGTNLDYVAAGACEMEARLNFWKGLAQTFHENQLRFGTVERVMRPVPADVLASLPETGVTG